MPAFRHSLDPLLGEVARALRSRATVELLNEAATRLASNLDGTKAPAVLALGASLLSLLPEAIRSARLFGLPAGITGRKERHPNSHQRVLSLSGTGSIRVWGPEGGSVLHHLEQASSPPIPEHWSSVPSGLWHQPSAGREGWIALALHTASADDLIDEYEDRGGT